MDDIEFTDELKEILSPLNVVSYHNQVCHIRAIVDGENIVYRVWNRRGYWVYICQWWYGFQLEHEKGKLKVLRKDKD